VSWLDGCGSCDSEFAVAACHQSLSVVPLHNNPATSSLSITKQRHPTRRTTCHIISANSNKGDGHTRCGELPSDFLEKRAENLQKYEVRGEISVMRLDRLVTQDMQVWLGLGWGYWGYELGCLLSGVTRYRQVHEIATG